MTADQLIDYVANNYDWYLSGKKAPISREQAIDRLWVDMTTITQTGKLFNPVCFRQIVEFIAGDCDYSKVVGE